MAEETRKSKKRKTDTQPLLRIGGKLVSFGDYLNHPGSKKLPLLTEKQGSTEEQTPTEAEPDSVSHAQNDSPDHTGSPAKLGRRKAADSPLLQSRKALPLWSYQQEIKSALAKNDVLLLVGETGSGKSTQVPQFLCTESWCRKRKVKVSTHPEPVNVGGMIAITQPRRVAATTLANRVAHEMGTPLAASGTREGSVGYSVRFDHHVPKGTKIKFLTEGMLLQEFLNDPHLRQYSAIIVDEIHERSVDVDLIAGFLKQILASDKAGRGGIPLKVVIMSATADVEKIQGFFTDNTDHAGPSLPFQVLKIKGRQYPVDIQHTDRPVPDVQEALLQQIFKIHLQEPLPGDILAFMTGQEEIESVQKLIEDYSATLATDVPKIVALPLYGQLSMAAQQEAFQPLKRGFTRKVVLATNIAETSVTVPGVRYVIDCGKAKVKQYRSRLGMESLLAKPISKSSAKQRAGRAGREGPGKCFRLYSKQTFDTLRDADLPEILRNDVLAAVLTMKARGINDILVFPLMDRPDVESVEKALLQLHSLAALNDDGTITAIGRKLALFPVSAPFGRVLLAASEPEFDCLLEAIDVIACITSGENIFHQLLSESEELEDVHEARKELYRREGDILTYLTTMQRYASENADRIEWCKKRRINIRNMKQALNIRRQLRSLCLQQKMLADAPPKDPQPFTPMSPERAELLLKCFLKGFVSRCALLAPDSSYVTVQGKHVVAIHPSSVLHGQKREAIMFLEHVFTQKSYAKKVSVVQADWIAEALS